MSMTAAKKRFAKLQWTTLAGVELGTLADTDVEVVLEPKYIERLIEHVNNNRECASDVPNERRFQRRFQHDRQLHDAKDDAHAHRAYAEPLSRAP